MTDDQRLSDIRRRLVEKRYQEKEAEGDVAALLRIIESKTRALEELEKKNNVLSQHVSELTQELENVRSDFGNLR